MQYKVVRITFINEENMEKLFNELSQEGWKPLHITPCIAAGYTNYFLITFAKE